jgi:hypothetical protein
MEKSKPRWDPRLEALRAIIKHLERLRGDGA